MLKTSQLESFDRTNGLGTISFSPELVTAIIKKVLDSFHNYVYLGHSIKQIQDMYHEFAIHIKTPEKELNFREIDRLQRELVFVAKQSLNLTCVVVIDIDNE